MTDAEVIAAIAKILHSRPRQRNMRHESTKANSVEEADLARFDQIVGLVERHLRSGGAA
jgi:hypothetical protein